MSQEIFKAVLSHSAANGMRHFTTKIPATINASTLYYLKKKVLMNVYSDVMLNRHNFNFLANIVRIPKLANPTVQMAMI